jgi:hypothetical protein
MEDGDSAEEEEAPARAGSAGRLPRVSSCEDAHTPPARAPRVSASAAPAAEEADALLKHRYRQYVCTQTLLTNLVRFGIKRMVVGHALGASSLLTPPPARLARWSSR